MDTRVKPAHDDRKCRCAGRAYPSSYAARTDPRKLSTSSFNRSDCDDSPGMFLLGYPAGAYLYAAGTGNAVTDLIFSIAKRDVTFLSGMAAMSFL